MSRSPKVWSLLLIATTLWIARAAHSETVYDLVEQGRLALVADKYADSFAALKKAIARPDFSSSDPGLQYFAYYLASFAAASVDDTATAYQYVVASTRFDDADGDTWIRRAGLATSQDKWDDAGKSLTAAATKWPKALTPDSYHARLVGSVVRELGKEPATRPQRLELLNALFAAEYKSNYGIEPSWFWQILATDALDRKDLKRAREVAKRITSTSTLMSMRTDHRFDALTAEDPRTFDVWTAAEREAKQLKAVAGKNPKDLGATVQYGYALYALGKFDELLSLADGVITKVEKAPKDQPPYEDLDESLNWIHNHKASALRALGRWDEAAAVLAAWERNPLNGDDKVSQAINLGFFFNELGRPDNALKAVNGLDTNKGMSGYGRTQYEFVRFQAYTQLGKQDDARGVATWLREHQKDSRQTAQDTLLESGDVDGAAAMLISRLRDSDERAAALAEVQIYAPTPRTERQKVLDALSEGLIARPDVTAAITEAGRREKFPIYSMEY